MRPPPGVPTRLPATTAVAARPPESPPARGRGRGVAMNGIARSRGGRGPAGAKLVATLAAASLLVTTGAMPATAGAGPAPVVRGAKPPTAQAAAATKLAAAVTSASTFKASVTAVEQALAHGGISTLSGKRVVV